MYARFGGRQTLNEMNERSERHNQRRQDRVSAAWLSNPSFNFPPVLSISAIFRIDCYQRQLQAENKSENTQKSYFYGLKPLIETVLPKELAIDELDYTTMTIETLALRNGT